MHCKAILCRVQPGLMRWILLCIMPQVQDRSLDHMHEEKSRESVASTTWFSLSMRGTNFFNRMNTCLNEWCFGPQCCTIKAILGRAQPGLMRWLLLWNHASPENPIWYQEHQYHNSFLPVFYPLMSRIPDGRKQCTLEINSSPAMMRDEGFPP